MDDKYLKRAGLDYWKDLQLKTHENWESFLKTVPDKKESHFFLKKMESTLFGMPIILQKVISFLDKKQEGSPASILETYHDQFYRIPQWGPIRSLNLSNSVAVALYEGMRKTSGGTFL